MGLWGGREGELVPRVSEFYGILIYMYFSDHAPPHFHAIYGRHEAEVAIGTERILDGWLPKRAHSLVREWAKLYRLELEQNWQKARAHEPLFQIPPLA